MENNQNITIVGSANYDTFIVTNRLPEMGETIAANKVATACGGKGANQAAAVGKLGLGAFFVGQVGNDESGKILKEELVHSNVNVDSIKVLSEETTGQAFIFSFENKNNSIIILGGANTNWKHNDLEECKNVLEKCKNIL
jgi:ribokinase